ncbi:MAG: hypothetical protein ACOYJQ_09290 [Pseudochelatococcus sp.]|jgi:hypothetical protein|uniref:hypothetical protein n=1 Tax=Pseudochelatococcus sp. TaxID=2020869 RepID=UPI003D90CD52
MINPDAPPADAAFPFSTREAMAPGLRSKPPARQYDGTTNELIPSDREAMMLHNT